MKEAYKRILSAIIGVILLVLFINKGDIYLNIGVLFLSLVGLREFYLAIKNIDINPLTYIGYLATILIFLNNIYPKISMSLIFVLLILSVLVIFLFSKDRTLTDIGLTVLSVLYIPFLFSYINRLDGNIYIWLIFIISFGTDTFAYLGGKYFGKNKLWPEISPNKTIEGSISGIIGSTLLTILFALIMKENRIYILVILAIIISIISQIGDLVASKIKRIAEVKDYGYIMPGHGGILDRFDSIILTAPLIYYYVSYFLN